MMNHLAYLEPGAASAVITLVAGGFAGLLVTVGVYWNRLLVFLHIRKPEQEEESAQQPYAS